MVKIHQDNFGRPVWLCCGDRNSNRNPDVGLMCFEHKQGRTTKVVSSKRNFSGDDLELAWVSFSAWNCSMWGTRLFFWTSLPRTVILAKRSTWTLLLWYWAWERTSALSIIWGVSLQTINGQPILRVTSLPCQSGVLKTKMRQGGFCPAQMLSCAHLSAFTGSFSPGLASRFIGVWSLSSTDAHVTAVRF